MHGSASTTTVSSSLSPMPQVCWVGYQTSMKVTDTSSLKNVSASDDGRPSSVSMIVSIFASPAVLTDEAAPARPARKSLSTSVALLNHDVGQSTLMFQDASDRSRNALRSFDVSGRIDVPNWRLTCPSEPWNDRPLGLAVIRVLPGSPLLPSTPLTSPAAIPSDVAS